MNHAKDRADRKAATDLEPWLELLPRPAVHADLASLAALAAPDEHGATATIEIALLERECFADSKARAPKQHDERSEAVAVGVIADRSHDRNDLFDRWRIGWVLLALIPWWAAWW